MGDTTIEWTDKTWNPLRGCRRVSEGCRHCYAERMALRFSGPGQPYEGLVRKVGNEARWTGEVRLVPELLLEPLRWRKPRRVFVNSMSDLFHEDVPFEFIARVFAVMGTAREHIFQVLTKRPARMLQFMDTLRNGYILDVPREAGDELWASYILPLPNVWLGVSVEDQAAADERIPLLLRTPAAVRWISAEPLFGPVDLSHYLVDDWTRIGDDVHYHVGDSLHWVVVGGESGPGARPMHPDWARSLRDQCQAAGVAYFFKQWGEWTPNLFDVFDDYVVAKALSGSYPTTTLWNNEQIVEGQRVGTSLESYRVGKKAAGRLLDGREWNEYPLVARPKTGGLDA